MPFKDGNLTPLQLKDIFSSVIKQRKIISHLEAVKNIYFGVSGTDKDFHDRMFRHNQNQKIKFVPSSNYNSCKLISVGDTFVLEDGQTVIVNENDIKKLEVLAITEFTYREFSNYSKKLINEKGGGEGLKFSEQKTLYFRYGNNEIKNIE